MTDSSSFWPRLRKWLAGDLVRGPIAEQTPHLTEWYKSPCGRLLLATEQEVINQSLPSLFGYHLVQLSVHTEADLVKASPIHHRCLVLDGPLPAGDSPLRKQVLRADFESLPLDCDSVDVMVLHHVLEFSPNPHQILKEVSRVLIPRGHVIIVGFNPFSLLGLWKGVASLLTRNPQWRYHTITQWRLQDWFKFLDLVRTRSTDCFYRPPCSSPMLLGRLHFLERLGKKFRLPLGGVYVMVARKDVTAVTPIRAPWDRLPRRLPGLAPVRPATRNCRGDSRMPGPDRLH